MGHNVRFVERYFATIVHLIVMIESAQENRLNNQFLSQWLYQEIHLNKPSMNIKLTIWQKIQLFLFHKVKVREGLWLYRGIKIAGKEFALPIQDEDEEEIREYYRKRKNFINDFTRVTRRDKWTLRKNYRL